MSAPVNAYFLHANRRHHSIALVQASFLGLITMETPARQLQGRRYFEPPAPSPSPEPAWRPPLPPTLGTTVPTGASGFVAICPGDRP